MAVALIDKIAYQYLEDRDPALHTIGVLALTRYDLVQSYETRSIYSCRRRVEVPISYDTIQIRTSSPQEDPTLFHKVLNVRDYP